MDAEVSAEILKTLNSIQNCLEAQTENLKKQGEQLDLILNQAKDDESEQQAKGDAATGVTATEDDSRLEEPGDVNVVAAPAKEEAPPSASGPTWEYDGIKTVLIIPRRHDPAPPLELLRSNGIRYFRCDPDALPKDVVVSGPDVEAVTRPATGSDKWVYCKKTAGPSYLGYMIP